MSPFPPHLFSPHLHRRSGSGNPLLVEIAHVPHFTQQYMYYFIDWNAENFGIYCTPEDFFPDGVPW